MPWTLLEPTIRNTMDLGPEPWTQYKLGLQESGTCQLTPLTQCTIITAFTPLGSPHELDLQLLLMIIDQVLAGHCPFRQQILALEP